MAKVSSFLDSVGFSTSLLSNVPWIMRNLITRLLVIVRTYTFNMVIKMIIIIIIIIIIANLTCMSIMQ